MRAQLSPPTGLLNYPDGMQLSASEEVGVWNYVRAFVAPVAEPCDTTVDGWTPGVVVDDATAYLTIERCGGGGSRKGQDAVRHAAKRLQRATLDVQHGRVAWPTTSVKRHWTLFEQHDLLPACYPVSRTSDGYTTEHLPHPTREHSPPQSTGTLQDHLAGVWRLPEDSLADKTLDEIMASRVYYGALIDACALEIIHTSASFDVSHGTPEEVGGAPPVELWPSAFSRSQRSGTDVLWLDSDPESGDTEEDVHRFVTDPEMRAGGEGNVTPLHFVSGVRMYTVAHLFPASVEIPENLRDFEATMRHNYSPVTCSDDAVSAGHHTRKVNNSFVAPVTCGVAVGRPKGMRALQRTGFMSTPENPIPGGLFSRQLCQIARDHATENLILSASRRPILVRSGRVYEMLHATFGLYDQYHTHACMPAIVQEVLDLETGATLGYIDWHALYLRTRTTPLCPGADTARQSFALLYGASTLAGSYTGVSRNPAWTWQFASEVVFRLAATVGTRGAGRMLASTFRLSTVPAASLLLTSPRAPYDLMEGLLPQPNPPPTTLPTRPRLNPTSRGGSVAKFDDTVTPAPFSPPDILSDIDSVTLLATHPTYDVYIYNDVVFHMAEMTRELGARLARLRGRPVSTYWDAIHSQDATTHPTKGRVLERGLQAECRRIAWVGRYLGCPDTLSPEGDVYSRLGSAERSCLLRHHGWEFELAGGTTTAAAHDLRYKTLDISGCDALLAPLLLSSDVPPALNTTYHPGARPPTPPGHPAGVPRAEAARWQMGFDRWKKEVDRWYAAFSEFCTAGSSTVQYMNTRIEWWRHEASEHGRLELASREYCSLPRRLVGRRPYSAIPGKPIYKEAVARDARLYQESIHSTTAAIKTLLPDYLAEMAANDHLGRPAVGCWYWIRPAGDPDLVPDTM